VTPHKPVRLERHRPSGVATIVIDRPKARNAMSRVMWQEFDMCVRSVATDRSIRALVIDGGPQAFVSGADIGDFLAFAGAADGLAYEDSVGAALRAFEALPIVTIAAISGACTGGGVVLASACDLRYGSADARVGMPIARTLGNITNAANVARIAAVIGSSRALEWLVTARLVDAATAERAGFFNAVFGSYEELQQHALATAEAIADNAPLTVRAAKEMVRRLREAARRDVDDRDLLELCYGSEDFREGAAAFIEKRSPDFRGR
jgi:enoyl-CoA hydratase/carnithine racemase